MTSAPFTTRARRSARWMLALWTLLFVAGGAQRARAHKELDEAKRLAGDLEFEASLAAFELALASGTLTREELIALLSERALVLHALRRQEDLIKDFIWLSALAPDHRLDLRAPPDLTATWTSVRDQGRGALKIELSAQANPNGSVDAEARLAGTVPEGARARLWRRSEPGEFEALAEPKLHEDMRKRPPLALYADAVILGGVQIAGEHNAENPLRIQADNRKESKARAWARRHKGWLIGGAAVAAVATVVITGLLLSRSNGEPSDTTDVTPMVTF